MRKEDLASLVVYLIMIAAAVIVGLTAVQATFQVHYHLSMPTYLFAIIVIVVGLIFNIIGLELSHVAGAKIGGYKILSINCVGFCFQKKGGKWKFSFKDFDGLTGETKIAPKSDKAKLAPYIWFPIVMYFAELAACIVVFTLAEDKSINAHSPLHWMAIASLLLIIIASMLALYNLVPIKLDSMTDGYRFTLLTKKENIDAFNELMRIEAAQMNDEDPGEIKVFNEITEFTASINLISVYIELKNKNYTRAEELIDMIVVDPKKVSPQTYNRLLSQKLYIKIMTLPLEEVKEYYDKNVDDFARKYIAHDLSMESIKAYVLIAGLLDKSRNEVEFAKSRKDRALKHTPHSRVEIENKLYEEALAKVYEAHPDWNN